MRASPRAIHGSPPHATDLPRHWLLAGLFCLYAGGMGMGGALWAIWIFGPALPPQAVVVPACGQGYDLYERVASLPGAQPTFQCFRAASSQAAEEVRRTAPTPAAPSTSLPPPYEPGR